MNETYDFGEYEEQARNCTSLFDGVYTYGCPESQSTAGYAECDAFQSAIDRTTENIVSQTKCANDTVDCDRKDTFKMNLFRNYHNHNIFNIRNGLFMTTML